MFKISSIIFCSIFNLIIGLFQKTHSIDFCSLIMEPRFLPTSYIEAPPRPFWAKWPPPSVPVRDPSPESPRRTSSSAHPPTFYVALFPIGPPSLPTPLSGANGAARRRRATRARSSVARSTASFFFFWRQFLTNGLSGSPLLRRRRHLRSLAPPLPVPALVGRPPRAVGLFAVRTHVLR